MTAGTRAVPGGRRNSPPMRAGIAPLTPVRNCLSVSVTDSNEWISILAVCAALRARSGSKLGFMVEGDTEGDGEAERLRFMNLTPSDQIPTPTMGAESSLP